MTDQRNSYYTAVELIEGEEISTDRNDMKDLAYALASDNPGKKYAVTKILDVFVGEHIDKNVVHTVRDKRLLLETQELNS